MKKAFIYLSVFVLFLLVVAAVLVIVPPTGYVRNAVIGGVRVATGLDLKVGGRVSMSVFPKLGLRMEDVLLVNPAAPPDKPLLAARAVEVRSELWPMVRGERRVERVILTEPRIDLEIGKDGRGNWEAPARTTRSVVAISTEPYSVVTLELTGATVAYRDHRSGSSARAEGAQAVVRDVRADRFAEAVVTAVKAAATEPSSASTVELSDFSATLSDFEGLKLREATGSSSTLTWRTSSQGPGLDAEKVTARIQALDASGTGALTVNGATAGLRDPAGATLASGRVVAVTAKSLKGGRLEEVALKSGSLMLGGVSRAPTGSQQSTAGTELQDVSLSAPVLAAGSPIDAVVGLVWNKERVVGNVKLPAPEVLTAGRDIPTTLVLKAGGGTVDFDGNIAASGNGLRGRAKAATTSLEAFGKLLGITLPSTFAGAGSLTGDIDAQVNRVALTNGRIEHAANALVGNISVDLGGARPLVTGKVAAEKLDADTYLGASEVKRSGPGRAPPRPVAVTPQVPVTEALKVYLRAMLDAPVRRNGTMEPVEVPLDALMPARVRSKREPDAFQWSDERIDFSALRTVDLDIDWSVKSLSVRGLDVSVPQLKTVLKNGDLTLDGRELSTRGGRINGKAGIDARQGTPLLSAALKAEGVDLMQVAEAFGVSALIAGSTSVEANLSGSGSSQKQLIETLSGTVKTRMGQGEVVGYDFSSITSWLFGSREYDPARRTAFSSLGANLTIDKGVVRESQVDLDGPIIGADAEGTIKLVEQEIDYRARLRLSSWLRGLSLRIFGDWSQPSVAPDLGSVFSRSPGSETTPVEMLAGVDLTDPELSTLIGQVLEKAGPRGLDPATQSSLRTLQQRAQGVR